ncbi:hypothetical protein L1987_85022 [Smallanthus sonchifolius]|uniref:Uncharacterized protein n=1 Tax=Smallanthus sonchifolius TaxID=185202 RepID=A0ACB8XVA3_9ASTR|nr:hypothetical protein L1987_85022 [Smallanthus sonchifolius]
MFLLSDEDQDDLSLPCYTSGELTLTFQGVLILRNVTTGNVIWSSVNSSTTSVRNPIGQLLDTCNFIIYDEGDVIKQQNPIWQSFDFITDTSLPGEKLGRNLVTGNKRHITSWKSEDDPAFGEFSYSIDTRGYPQAVLKEGQEVKFWRGPWTGLRYTGSWFYNFTFVLNQKEIYYEYNLIDASIFIRLVTQPNGRVERLLWIDSEQKWNVYTTPQIDRCDQYALCGPFGICNIRIPGNASVHAPENRSGEEDLELPLFGLSTLLKATNNFSINNKLGEDGFGPVYKGVSEDGREIAETK